MDREAIAAARMVINRVLGIRDGETVLITNDSPKTTDLSSLLASAIWEAAATPVELFMTKLARPGSPIPLLITQAAHHADVWIELNEIYILGTPADHDARRAGTRRFYSLSGMTVDDLILLELKVDRLALAELGERLGELTTGKEELRITCDSGSSFRASIRDCVASPDTTTMPLGQTHISPIEESVSGRLVFDGSAFPPESLTVLKDTISIEFSDGLSRVTGDGSEAQVLASWREWNDDPGIHRLNHVSYGYHPNVPLPTGRLVADERVFGCLCVGFGPRAPRGAYQSCGGERTSPRVCRSGHVEAGGSLNPGTRVRVESSPDNDGTDQYCQMVRVRLARQKGVREEPASESSSRNLAARIWRIRAAQQRTPAQNAVSGDSSGRLRTPTGRPR